MVQAQPLPYNPGDRVCFTDPRDCFTTIGVIDGGPVSNGRFIRAWTVAFDEGYTLLIPEQFMSLARPAAPRLVTFDGERIAP